LQRRVFLFSIGIEASWRSEVHGIGREEVFSGGKCCRRRGFSRWLAGDGKALVAALKRERRRGQMKE
jgi:hypothetical protein